MALGRVRPTIEGATNMAAEIWRVYRDGEQKSGDLTSENDCFRYILDNQGQSVDWAMKHVGWSYKQVG